MPSITNFLAGIATGAAGGIAADKLTDAIDSGLLPHVKDSWELFIETFPDEWQRLQKNIEKIAQVDALGPIRRTANLFPYPQEEKLFYQGRSHLSVFLLAQTQVQIWVAGLGTYTTNLAAGWNALDLPDGSTLSLPSAATGFTPILIMASDTTIGDAI
jgi:hypothetical protein